MPGFYHNPLPLVNSTTPSPLPQPGKLRLRARILTLAAAPGRPALPGSA